MACRRLLLLLSRTAQAEQSIASRHPLTGSLGSSQGLAARLTCPPCGSLASCLGPSLLATPPTARCIASSTAPAMSAKLSAILAEELKHEKTAYEAPEAVAAGPPAPFTLSEAPGDTMLTLSRTYDSERVSVDLHVNNQPGVDVGADADEDEAELSTVVFNVQVTKGDTSLVFECESDGTFVAVNHVSHEPKDGIDSESMYTGPVFDELDERLQTEFRTYLQERGITPELGEYLRQLVYDKEVREYINWLEAVSAFITKK